MTETINYFFLKAQSIPLLSMRKKPFKPYVYLLYTVCVKTEKESKVIILYFMLEICLCPVDDHSSLCLLEEN